MTVGIVDTTVILHYFRKDSTAQAWVENQPIPLSVTPITWLEVMHGAAGKSGQKTCKSILGLFEMEFLTASDMQWAMDQMDAYRLSRGIDVNDCLIASVCHRLSVPIYTHNTKDFLRLLPAELVIKPYW